MLQIEIVLLLSSTTISTILFIVAVFCCRNIILRHATNPVFQLRRPYFVSYVIIIISINMLLRSIIALLLYNSLISMILFRELLRFLAIFGEMLCLIQRMYFLAYDLKQIKYKENKLLSKYLQRGNDIKQTLNLMSQYSTIQKQTPSIATNSFAPEQLSLKKNEKNISGTSFNSNNATFYEKLLYYKQYFGNIKIMTSVFCSILVLSIFMPGLFVCIFVQSENICYNFQVYITNIFALCLVILYILFVIYISYNPFTPNFNDPSNWVNKYKLCFCYRNKFNQEIRNKDKDKNIKHNYIYNQDLHLSNYDDYNISLELTIILLIIGILSVIFITIEMLNYYNYFNYFNYDYDFYFVLLYIIILTIGGILIVLTLIFIPYFAIQKEHKKYKFGKSKSGKYQLALKDILSHYKGFYAFVKTLREEHSLENVMFLIEIWQYKYYPSKINNNKSETINKTIVETTNNNENENDNNTNDTDNNTNNIEGNNDTNNTLFNMKVNMLLNALEDDETGETSEEYDEVSDYDYNDYNEYYEYNTNMIYNLHLHQSKEEINECLKILENFPWYKLPISDSHRKYIDKYFCAVHIFNKYLSRCAFDLLNISQMSLTHIESTLHCLYEYKLDSFHIGIEFDENEKKQLKSDCQTSTQSTSRHTNFDFVEPTDTIDTNINETSFDKNVLPNINVSNCISISSETTPNDLYSPVSNSEKENHLKEIKRKQKLREQLGLKIHFASNAMDKKIQNQSEFEEKLLSVFDICLPDIFNNLESALTRFKATKEYYCCLADKLQLLN